MMKSKAILVACCCLFMASCGDMYLERGLSGAAVGAGVAAATDNDVGTGAAIGAAGGVITR